MATHRVKTAIGSDFKDFPIERMKWGKPPVVFEVQVLGYVPLETPEELKQWQEDLKTYYGMSLDAANLPGTMAESGCSIDGRCCSDRCDAA